MSLRSGWNDGKRRVRRSLPYIKAALTSKVVWIGVSGLVLFGVVFYVALNFFIMPSYTRYDVAVEVPDVRAMSLDEASRVIRAKNLRVEMDVQQYNPEVPTNHVVDQDPSPHVRVKPGRRIYLMINSGEQPMVEIPNLRNVSLRQARAQLVSRGLDIGEVHIDSIPSPYRNTITRQHPAPGQLVPRTTRVELWVSAGLGEVRVVVPDLLGLTLDEADRATRQARLRLIVPEGTTEEEALDSVVIEQDPPPLITVAEGTEIRVYLGHRPGDETDEIEVFDLPERDPLEWR